MRKIANIMTKKGVKNDKNISWDYDTVKRLSSAVNNQVLEPKAPEACMF